MRNRRRLQKDLSKKTMSENNAKDTCDGLDLAATSDLLRQQGYDISCQFGHVHATTDTQELHVYLLADLV